MDLLEFTIELDIQYYLEVKNMITFTTGLDIFYVKKVLLQISFLIIIQKSK